MKWLLASLATLLLWGAWGVALKRVSSGAPWYSVYAATNLAIVAGVAIVVAARGPGVLLSRGPGWLLAAVATGAAGTLGYVFMVLALEWGGRASIVVPLTALYPAVTVVLSRLLLGEQVGTRQALGVVLALAAVVLLSWES